jgi:alkylhydroperoxidase family enzyme
VPNLYRSLGHVPQLVDGWIDFARLLHREVTVDEAIRELAIMRKAYLHGVDYLWRNHWRTAIKAGITPGKLMALPDWRASSQFTSAEVAALEMVDQLSSKGVLTPALWQELHRHFTDQKTVELVVSIAFYSCVSQTMASLEVAVDDTLTDVPPVPAHATPDGDLH